MHRCQQLSLQSILRLSTNLVSLVTEKVDLREVLVFDMTQAVRLVPTVWEDVKGDLAADREREAVVGELLLEDFDEGLADARFLSILVSSGRDGVKLLRTLSYSSNSLRSAILHHINVQCRCHYNIQEHLRRVTPKRTDIDHAVAELDECPPATITLDSKQHTQLNDTYRLIGISKSAM